MNKRGRPRHPETLTPRQQDVLLLLRQGLTNEEIAGQLGISADGVKYHVSDILRRLHVESRHEAALWQPEPAARRPWALAALPLGWVSKVKWSTAGYVAGGAVVTVAAVGLGLLLWGVVRSTTGDESTRGVIDADRIVAASEIPLLPPGESQVLSYDTASGSLDVLPVSALEPSALSPNGSSIAIALGNQLLVSDLNGVQHTIDRTAAGAEPTDWSDDGQRMLVVGGEGLRVLRVDTGRVATLLAGNVQDAVWSPDERRVAFVRDQRLGVLDLASGESSIIVPELTAIYLPYYYGRGHLAWSPDGETIAFAHWTAEEPVTQGRSDVYVVNTDGTGLRRLTDSTRAKASLAFSPGGEYLSYVQNTDAGDKLRIIEVESGRQVALDAPAMMSFPTPWIADDALLTSDYSGVSLARTDGSVRLLIASASTGSAQCTRSLIGWASGRIIFRNACYGAGN
jgi:DNA-binding CsgD family transcriptional regulator/dipeptidyl aminopeptidase/acylaminoacyl peptidase